MDEVVSVHCSFLVKKQKIVKDAVRIYHKPR